MYLKHRLDHREIICFQYQKTSYLDQSIQKTEALTVSEHVFKLNQIFQGCFDPTDLHICYNKNGLYVSRLPKPTIGSSLFTKQQSYATVPVHLSSKLHNIYIYRYFDPENDFLDNENKYFLG